MRVQRLDLIAYGPFSGTSLDLSAGNAGLHLVYGDNEAGKSTSLRALIAWLFGIPTRTDDNFLHAYPQLRVGGVLQLSSGDEIAFVRRKANKGTLLHPESGDPMDDSALERFLPGIDELLFTRLYGIDHERLIKGGQEILKQSGDLGQALFSAAAGTADLRKLMDQLDEGADDLFKPRGSTKLVNQAVARFRDAYKRVKDASLPVAQWRKLQDELVLANKTIGLVEAEIKHLSRDKSRLERLRRVRGVLAQRRDVLRRSDELGDVLLLPEEFGEMRRRAQDRLQGAEESLKRAEGKLTPRRVELDGLSVRGDLLESEKTISSLYKELGAVEKGAGDRPRQDGKRRLLRNEAKQVLEGVRPDLGLDDAESLRPLMNNLKWIAGLAQEHGLLEDRDKGAAGTLRDIEDESKALRQELDGLGRSGADVTDLKAAVASARKAGDLEKRLAEAVELAKLEQASCAEELARLGRFSGSIDELALLSPPVAETLDRFERRNDALDDRARDRERRRKELELERAKAQQDLHALLSLTDVPSVEDLEGARSLRDEGWQLVRRKFIAGESVEAEAQSYAGDRDLPAAYEQNVATADEVSDRLRHDADQVHKRVHLETLIERLDSDAARVAEEAGADEEDRGRCDTEWRAIWAPMSIDPATPREMKQWLPRVDRLLARGESARRAKTATERMEAERRAHVEALTGQLAALDATPETESSGLEELLNGCEQRIELEESAATSQLELERSIREKQVRLERAQVDLKSVRAEMVRWEQEWRQSIDGLGLKPDAHPEQTTAFTEQLAIFFGKLDQSEDLGRRIYGIDQYAREFEEKVFAFADKVELDHNGQDAAEVVGLLHRELKHAGEARARRTALEGQIQELDEEAEDARATIHSERERLTALRKQARVESDEGLERAEEHSKTHRMLQQSLDTLQQELARNGDGITVEELEREEQASDMDAVEADLQQASSELEDLQQRRDSLRDQRRSLQDEIQAKDGSATAAEASEDAEQHLAAVVSGAEQYLRLKIASLILEEQIERYRKANQAPVLSRAGELFRRLTLDAFAGLRDELDDRGKPVLLGVRPDDREVGVAGMSDGSRDQLFLALRHATLEQHLQGAEPMPFVVDDILIGFDDGRTRACLEVLAELARKTQVLLFTHHRRVVELAGAINAEAGVYVHELG
jgi:uncharacterized protein YhaN